MRTVFGEDAFDLGGVEGEVVGPLPLHDRCSRHPGDLGVHLICRLEGDDRSTRPGVGQQDRLEHLVGAVGSEHLGRVDTVRRGDRLAQLGGGAVGIAVPVDPRHLRGNGVAKGGRRRLR